MQIDRPFLNESHKRLVSGARIRFRILGGSPISIGNGLCASSSMRVVHQIRLNGQTLFEGTETATNEKFESLNNGGLFGSEFYEMGAGV